MPRISALDPAAVTGRSKELLDEVQAAFGTTPNITRTLAHSPAALEAWWALNGALGRTLTAKLREQLAVAIAEANGCAYCLSAHTAVGRMVGLDDEELARNRAAASSDPRTEAALRFALAVLEERGRVSDEELGAVRAAGFGDGEIAEIVAHVALHVLTNYFNKVAETEVDFPLVEPGLARVV